MKAKSSAGKQARWRRATARRPFPFPQSWGKGGSVIVDYFTNMGRAIAFFADGLEENDPTIRMVALANVGEFQQQFLTDGTPIFDELAVLHLRCVRVLAADATPPAAPVPACVAPGSPAR